MKRVLIAAAFAATVMAAGLSAAPAPTSAAVAQPAAAVTRVSWATFLAHTGTVLDRQIAIGDDIGFDYDWDDSAGLAADYTRLSSSAWAEKRWIVTHKPAACFASVWSAWLNMQSKTYVYSTAWARWNRQYPYGTDHDYNVGMSAIKSATSWTDTFSARLKTTHC